MQQNYAQWQQWMIAAQAGDADAYRKLLKDITPLLRNFIRKRLFDAERVEDVVQETLMGLHKMRHTYNPSQPFETWMFAITRYKVIDAIRQIKRQQARESYVADDDEYSFYETIADTKTNIGTADIRQDLIKALTTLPKKQRTIVTMLKVEGLSAAEVALKMDMSVSAVKVAAHRAYKKLRGELEGHGE
ncbi:MAG: sigma-70 family RNA polymerase sigma factor [Alphaproteobacteria bacterium]|nr:sigma-70 family RNA polymerase sigma factor [Alphaproteobacteria bacterium]MDD9919499.1 sigma-70 family RNA polymerase sigma factor [Alphaproteobacteria bacterium]